MRITPPCHSGPTACKGSPRHARSRDRRKDCSPARESGLSRILCWGRNRFEFGRNARFGAVCSPIIQLEEIVYFAQVDSSVPFRARVTRILLGGCFPIRAGRIRFTRWCVRKRFILAHWGFPLTKDCSISGRQNISGLPTGISTTVGRFVTFLPALDYDHGARCRSGTLWWLWGSFFVAWRWATALGYLSGVHYYRLGEVPGDCIGIFASQLPSFDGGFERIGGFLSLFKSLVIRAVRGYAWFFKDFVIL